jgi:hypothetical protein
MSNGMYDAGYNETAVFYLFCQLQFCYQNHTMEDSGSADK